MASKWCWKPLHTFDPCCLSCLSTKLLKTLLDDTKRCRESSDSSNKTRAHFFNFILITPCLIQNSQKCCTLELLAYFKFLKADWRVKHSSFQAQESASWLTQFMSLIQPTISTLCIFIIYLTWLCVSVLIKICFIMLVLFLYLVWTIIYI